MFLIDNAMDGLAMAQVESPLPVSNLTREASQFKKIQKNKNQVIRTYESATAHVGSVGGYGSLLLENVLVKAEWHHRTFVVQPPTGYHLATGRKSACHHLTRQCKIC